MDALLHRVGAALGARDGTGPDDDPMLRWHRHQGRTEGVALGMVRAILRARGIAVSEQGLGRVPEIDATPVDAVVCPALACDDEADFLARLRRRC